MLCDTIFADWYLTINYLFTVLSVTNFTLSNIEHISELFSPAKLGDFENTR